MALAASFLAGYENEAKYRDLGRKLADTCHEFYVRSNSKLAPAMFTFGAKATQGQEATLNLDYNSDGAKIYEYPSQNHRDLLLFVAKNT